MTPFFHDKMKMYLLMYMKSSYSKFSFFLGKGEIDAMGANIISEPTQNMLSHGSIWTPSSFGITEDYIFMGTRNKHPD